MISTYMKGAHQWTNSQWTEGEKHLQKYWIHERTWTLIAKATELNGVANTHAPSFSSITAWYGW